MTHQKLRQANDLSKQIHDLSNIISNCKSQKCEWIEFTFGNGSNRANVCNDKEIIDLVRSLILKKSQLKLTQLEIDFAEL